ncbi:MAG: C4-dicarboxylate ABC transporter, partial [Polaromonas sp.]|nr:C4-dicarboxylate ABC transporter [Polaromonas sp.]
MSKLIHKAPLAIAAAALLAAGGAHAQTVKIKIADSFPVGHYLPKYFTLPMIERLKANPAAKGYEFEYYPAEQLGKAKDLL